MDASRESIEGLVADARSEIVDCCSNPYHASLRGRHELREGERGKMSLVTEFLQYYNIGHKFKI
jgi:hypothetical protein